MNYSILSTNRRLLRNLVIGFSTLLLIVGINLSFNGSISMANQSTENITTLYPSGEPVMGIGWPLTSKSGESELALAAHLKKIGTKYYGSWNCDHCYAQRQLFGVEAFKSINYIECSEQGVNSQSRLCLKEGIRGLPTWDINGKKYPGIVSPEKLSILSDYKGPQKFRYSKLIKKQQSNYSALKSGYE
jgi:hypothetical protein